MSRDSSMSPFLTRAPGTDSDARARRRRVATGEMADAREVRSEVLARFWSLASEDREARVRACEALMDDLDDAREGGGGGGGDGRGDVGRAGDGKSDGRGRSENEDDGADVRAYALRRLTRGLSSGRGGARQGFALALSELASSETLGTTPMEALEALDANVAAITKSTKGEEARDILLGRMFGLAAIGIALGARTDLDEEARTRCGAEVMTRARALSKEKTYLCEPVAACVVEMRRVLGNETFAAVAERAGEDLAEWLRGECAADTLWLACELCDVLPANTRDSIAWLPTCKSKKKGVKSVDWKEVFTRAGLRKISTALVNAAHTHPRMHNAWEMILREVSQAGGVVSLWEVVCEEGLFVSGSHQRRFLGFRVFDTLLSSAEAHEIPALFSNNFIKCLLNNLSAPDNYLHECAVDCLARIVAFASDKKTESSKKIAVIAALQRQGPTRFDNVTKTKAVQDLVKSLDSEDAVHYLEGMYGIVTTAPEQDPDVVGTEEELASALANGTNQKRRLWALEQMAGLIPMLPNDKVVELMQFMLFHAYYKTAGKPKKGKSKVSDRLLKSPLEEPTGSVRAACSTRFLAMLNSNVRAQRANANKDPDEATEVVDLLNEATAFCRMLEGETSVEMCDAIPDEYQQIRDELLKTLDACEKSDKELARKVMPLIRVLSVLQVSDWREFTPALQDLPRCVSELIAPKKKAKKTKKGDEEEPEAIDVLVDIILSLLAQPSALLRDVVEHTFKAISGQVSKEGIQDMLRIVTGPEVGDDAEEAEGEGEDVLMEDDDSDIDDDDEDEDDEDEDEDDEDDEDEDFGEANEDEIAAMRAAASKIVGAANDDSDESDSDSEGMDDAAMFRIDKLLAEAFKSRQQDLMRKKNLKRATRDFKFRVISLFQLYAKAQPGSAYLPGSVVTLLDAMRDTLGKQDPQSTQLAERIASLISKHIAHARDLPEVADEETSADSIKEKLMSVIISANRGASDGQLFNKTATAAAAYLLRVLEAVAVREQGGKTADQGSEVASDQGIECYRDALKMFKSKKSRLKTGFFSQTFVRHPALACALLPELFELVAQDADKANARGEFLRLEGLKLVIPVIQAGKKRYPPLAKSAKKSMKTISQSLAAVVSAPYKNKNARADACQQAANCIESLNRLLGDVDIKTMIDVDAIVDAIAKQMSRPPALPQKAQKAFGRICALLGRDVPNVRVQDVTNDDDEDDDDDDGSDSEEEAPKRKSKKRASTDGGKPKSSKKQKKRA